MARKATNVNMEGCRAEGHNSGGAEASRAAGREGWMILSMIYISQCLVVRSTNVSDL